MRKLALLLLLMGNAPAAPAGSVTGSVVSLVKAKHVPPTYVYVYLKPVKTRYGKAPGIGQKFAIHQHQKQFEPHVLVIPRGATVWFPNDDGNETHNVFSNDEPHFDLGRANGTESKSLNETFDEGNVFGVYCDIHQQMWAKVKVVDTVHIAPVDAQGHYTLGNVEPGTYQVVAWAPDSDEALSEKLVVKDGETTQAKDIKLQIAPIATDHMRKDGRPYCPYGSKCS